MTAASRIIPNILYVRMIRKEIPDPIKKGQAVILSIPVHTDAGTSNNRLLSGRDNTTLGFGPVFSIACIISLFVLQIIVPVKLKKNTEKSCGMKFQTSEMRG